MNLALFGSGEFTDAVDDIDKYLIDSFKPRNVAVLPTAAGMESDVHKWIVMAQTHYAKLDLAVIPISVLNKDQANDQDLIAPLSEVDWIFFSGGNPGYLLETIHKTKLWEVIMQRVNDGALLAGSSAGAMVMGKYLLTAPSFKAMFSGHGTLWQDGFGLVDYTILPHFDHFKKYQGLVNKIIDTSPDKVRSAWMGIDENTAIIYSNDEPVVRGVGGVEMHTQDSVQHLKQ
jgi:cyanophycinase